MAPQNQPAPARVLWLPLALTAGLLLLSLLDRVQANAVLDALGVGGGGGVAGVAGRAAAARERRRACGGRSSLLRPRPQHYVQALCHLSVYVYWGWYWRPVYDYAWLLVAQLLFAYAFDMLLAWSRRDSYALGFGPFPIVFSTNLFLWFRDDWFYLQFLLVAVGFLGKEFVRWHRDRADSVHIFNPSAFSLGLFSLVLIATGTTHLTRGQEIATTLSLAPHIYLFLFLVGLVVMYFFSITPVAASAAATLFAAERALLVADRRAVLPRLRDPAGGVSRTAPARHRSVHLAGNAARPDRLRRALRARRVRPLLAARRHRRADLLRQAAVRAAVEPERAVDRSHGSRHRPARRS